MGGDLKVMREGLQLEIGMVVSKYCDWICFGVLFVLWIGVLLEQKVEKYKRCYCIFSRVVSENDVVYFFVCKQLLFDVCGNGGYYVVSIVEEFGMGLDIDLLFF